MTKKISDQSNLKDFADDKINVTYKMNLFMGRVENSVGKGENAGYQHFLLFPQISRNFAFSCYASAESSVSSPIISNDMNLRRITSSL